MLLRILQFTAWFLVHLTPKVQQPTLAINNLHTRTYSTLILPISHTIKKQFYFIPAKDINLTFLHIVLYLQCYYPLTVYPFEASLYLPHTSYFSFVASASLETLHFLSSNVDTVSEKLWPNLRKTTPAKVCQL